MNKRYWDRVAADYDVEIFDSLANDRRNSILRQMNKYQAPDGVACDVGCGVGKYLPDLSERFGRVYAIDISEPLLERARAYCAELTNITYVQADLSKAPPRTRKPSFITSINVLIMSARRVRRRILQHIFQKLSPGGHALLVIPSLESALLTNHRHIDWNLRQGWSYRRACAEGLQPYGAAQGSIVEGIIEIDGVATKHYVREELLVALEDTGFSIVSVDKVEYGWETEFHNPPEWMQAPYPWDWLAVAKKP